MNEKKLWFMAGLLDEDKLVFSASNCDAIFSYDMNDESISLIMQTDLNDSSKRKRYHRECYKYRDKLVLIPQKGGSIDIYDINVMDKKSIKFADDFSIKTVASAEIFEDKLYVIPLGRECSPLVIDLNSLEVLEHDSFTKSILHIAIDYKEGGEFLFTRSFIKDGVIYAGIYMTSFYMAYDINNNVVNVCNTDISDIYCVQKGKEGIWILGITGEIEFITDNDERTVYSDILPKLNDGQWAYNRLIDVDGVGIALPAFAENIVMLKEGKTRVLPYPDKFKEIMNPQLVSFFNGIVFKKKVYVFPYSYPCILVVDEDNISIKDIYFRPNSNSKREMMIFKKEMEYDCRDNNGLLYEGQKYKLDDFVRLI